MEDMINHPKHYTQCAVNVEPIELTSRLDSCLGQAINYVMRANFKGSKREDLEKAIYYLEREMSLRTSSDYQYGYKTYDTLAYEAVAFVQCFSLLSNDELTKNVLTQLFEDMILDNKNVVSEINIIHAIEFIEEELSNLTDN